MARLIVYGLSRIIVIVQINSQQQLVAAFWQVSILHLTDLTSLWETITFCSWVAASLLLCTHTLPIILPGELLFLVLSSSLLIPTYSYSHCNSHLLAILGVRGERGSEEKMERLGLLVLPPPVPHSCPLPCPSILRGLVMRPAAAASTPAEAEARGRGSTMRIS